MSSENSLFWNGFFSAVFLSYFGMNSLLCCFKICFVVWSEYSENSLFGMNSYIFSGMVWFCEFKSLKAIEASMELMSASMELMSIRPFQIEGKAPFILHVEKEKNSVLLLILIEEPS